MMLHELYTEGKIELKWAYINFALSFIVLEYLGYSSVYIGKKIETS